jgi:hypothetical protein
VDFYDFMFYGQFVFRGDWRTCRFADAVAFCERQNLQPVMRGKAESNWGMKIMALQINLNFPQK